ncbi:hypothetical protein JW865_08895, partial [Candidatus Bathyarchaeota archaeon]|nr:hypothetical protein [Candidatus Bathyarchaeota archaeon]
CLEGQDIYQTNLSWMQGELNITFLEPVGDLIKFKASINVSYHSQLVYNRSRTLLYNPVTNEVFYINQSVIGITLFFKNPGNLLKDELISNVPGFEYVCEMVRKENCDTVAGRQPCVTTKSFNVEYSKGSICLYGEYDEDTGILVYTRNSVVDPILYSLGIMILSTNWVNLVNKVDLGSTIFEWDLLLMKIGVISGILLLLFLIIKRKRVVQFLKNIRSKPIIETSSILSDSSKDSPILLLTSECNA